MFGGFNIVEYVVKKGDSLFTIGKKYNVTPDEIMSFNNMQSSLIYPNQILFIPQNRSNKGLITNQYITEKGDTFEKIVKMYGNDNDDFYKYSDILKLELVPNQIINLKDTRVKRTHLLKPTDTVESILNQYGITYQDLLKLNEANWLIIGDSINVK